ncbi:LysR family transcriptional regulator [Leisingera sp. ANG-Vp]|uniref:LysR family transcriptional regulator n=1 Tax=Leisingera sp. ANG-Vp TaxID=1577896 RepID=UPI000AC40CC1|nr:LysR family transcriptional regulator [Leisingera sp. ANG-Vp]
MNTRALETLVRINQVQSFSKAAELQNMTLSALSMQMKSLETELNAQLFDRSFRPPKLTPLGRKVAAKALRVLEEQSELIALCGKDGELTGRFRLGMISSASVRLLPHFMAQISRIAPSAEFALSTGLSEQLFEQVHLGLLDAAVVTRVPQAPPDLRFDTIHQEEMVYAVPKSYAGRPLEDVSRLLPFIHFRPSTGIGNLIADYLKDNTEQPKQTTILDNLEASMEFVKSGLGYTLLPAPDVERCSDERVHIITDHAKRMFRELALVSRQEGLNRHWNDEILRIFRSLLPPPD